MDISHYFAALLFICFISHISAGSILRDRGKDDKVIDDEARPDIDETDDRVISDKDEVILDSDEVKSDNVEGKLGDGEVRPDGDEVRLNSKEVIPDGDEEVGPGDNNEVGFEEANPDGDEEVRPDENEPGNIESDQPNNDVQVDAPARDADDRLDSDEREPLFDVPDHFAAADSEKDNDKKLQFENADDEVVHLDDRPDSHAKGEADDREHSPDVKFEYHDTGVLDHEVAPPDHIAAMKMERDGDDNSNYHKEVFLGKEVDKFNNGDYKLHQQREKLKDIFTAVDLNADGFLDESELTDWVMTKTREHFYEARINNEKTFRMLDIDEDEKVTWNEFISQFLSEKGMNKRDVYIQLSAGESVKIPEDLEMKIQELREKWIQVQDIGKKYLTITQFFDFEHPETSKESLKFLVEDILHDMDTDNSNDITIQEYVALSPDTDVDKVNDIWVVARRDEFRNVIDLDKDGLVDVKELEAYLDPLSRTMAGQEARQLIGFGDFNEDGKLTLKEILENSEFYTGSKLYNYAQSIHEEF